MLEDAERQYGMANHFICALIYFITFGKLDESLEEYMSFLHELIECIKVICKKWAEYLESSLESRSTLSYQTYAAQISSGPGTPKFHIAKDQLEYLSSLSFKWNEVAALLGVSRMTIYKYFMYMGGRGLARDNHFYADCTLTPVTRIKSEWAHFWASLIT